MRHKRQPWESKGPTSPLAWHDWYSWAEYWPAASGSSGSSDWTGSWNWYGSWLTCWTRPLTSCSQKFHVYTPILHEKRHMSKTPVTKGRPLFFKLLAQPLFSVAGAAHFSLIRWRSPFFGLLEGWSHAEFDFLGLLHYARSAVLHKYSLFLHICSFYALVFGDCRIFCHFLPCLADIWASKALKN